MRPFLILAAVAALWAAPASASSFQTFGAPKTGASPSVIVYAKPAAPAAAPKQAAVTLASCKHAYRSSPSVIALGAPLPPVSAEMTAAIRPKRDRNFGLGPLLIRGGIPAFGSAPAQPEVAVPKDAKPGEPAPPANENAEPETEG